MPTADVTARFCADLMAGLADSGVELVIVSPGSRNTPLTLAALAEPRLRAVSIRDERSAGFMALGHAKVSGVPAAVICTSGSAAAHYYPAIVEADQSTTPLIALTSDRPRSLRDTFAPQTMNQVDLFGSHVVSSLDIDVDAADGRDTGRTLVASAMGPIRGPVHANLPFDEPLTPTVAIDASPAGSATFPAHSMGASEPRPELADAERMLVVVSGPLRPQAATALAALAHAWQAPVLADAQTTIDGSTVIEYPDLIAGARLADGTAALDALRPDHIIRIGPLPTSKPLWQWLETCGVPQTLIHPSRLSDPLHTAEAITTDPTPTLAAIAGIARAGRGDTAFLERWQAVDLAVATTVGHALAALPFPNEPEVARIVATASGGDAVLFMASSMPIRDVDGFAPRNRWGHRIANRGVNGIDGNLSTAIGAAMTGRPTTALVGDIAALHDVSAIAEAVHLGVPLRIVVVNNDGGGIFSFLPQATSPVVSREAFESMWGTPHGLGLADIATSMGMPSRTVATREDLAAAIEHPPPAPELIELHTDRTTNVEHHRALRTAVDAAVDAVVAATTTEPD